MIDLQTIPLCPLLNGNLKTVNEALSFFQSNWSHWINQRAKAYWLRKGEDDLGFLYAKIKSRNNQNIIREIQTDQGTFSTHSSIAEAVISHFQRFYSPPVSGNWERDSMPVGKCIPSELVPSLTLPFTDVEIKRTFFSGKTKASPGPDGFTYDFYKKSWVLLGPKICKAVRSFFITGFMPRATKATAITLIPKNQHASHIADYRPISLCNVFYKVVAKLIANRLKLVLPFIIQDNQAGFIAKRSSSDNIHLAADLLREFKDGSNSFCAKLDIKKAFDSLSRDFLLHRMKLIGFPDIFIKWIKGCIEDVFFSICINGSLEGFFPSTSGLRQGCPLSPLLFCIAMDALSTSLAPSRFMGISCNGLVINHLMYADDLLVFGKADEDNVRSLKEILHLFGQASNLNINPNKSSIMFSRDATSTSFLADLLGIHQAATSLTYLGLPISIKRLSYSHFLPLMNRITCLFEGWKIKFLSFAGRLQFLKFTIDNTIAYWIRGSIIPKACRVFISKICAKFLLHGNINERKLHLIAWKNITKPKTCGGLGILSFEAYYFAVACTFIWNWYHNSSLATSWFKAKYESPFKPPNSASSKFWKEICMVAYKIKSKISFSIDRNCNFSFLWDPWLNGYLLGEVFNDTRLSFKEVSTFTISGSWVLPSYMPPVISDLIGSIAIGWNSSITWDGLAAPSFKTFSGIFYSNLEEVYWHRFIWHKYGSLKFDCFAWMALLGKLKCADVLLKRGLQVNPKCSFCDTSLESHNHIFFECDYSFMVLLLVLPNFDSFLFRPNLLQVFDCLDLKFTGSLEKTFCFSIIAYLIYFLWRERNNRRFSNTWLPPSEIADNIKKVVRVKAGNRKYEDIRILQQKFSSLL
ncbi:Putative ribonuclease H protein [Dendrobium catenatum]|uniref:Ribonuclease H protein n=1 Tax=Dendrobium catenatum TaxID=906689 RepID=A0A2I0VJT4_9ASPA|nr:Putative ribonuclease H protein [Dendrobium catenatum]